MRAALLAIALLAAVWPAVAAAQCGPGQLCPSPPPGAYGPPAWRPGPTQPFQPPSQAARPGVVRVRCGTSLGSGTIVDTSGGVSTVITCWHVVEERGPLSVILPDGRPYAATLVAADQSNDLAVLESTAIPGPTVGVSDGPASGRLTVGGYGSSGRYAESSGMLAGQVTAAGTSSPSLIVNAPVRPGDSGGPVLDSRGLMIGVLWGTRNGQTYAMHGRPLRTLMDRIRARRRARLEAIKPPSSPKGPAGDGMAPVSPTPPASCDCAGRWGELDGRLDAIDTRLDGLDAALRDRPPAVTAEDVAAARDAAAAAMEKAEEADARSVSVFNRAVMAARDRAREVVGERLAQLDVPQTVSTAWAAIAGALGLGGPAALIAGFFVRRVGRRLERRIDERLSRRGQGVRDEERFP